MNNTIMTHLIYIPNNTMWMDQINNIYSCVLSYFYVPKPKHQETQETNEITAKDIKNKKSEAIIEAMQEKEYSFWFKAGLVIVSFLSWNE